ncbi:MAG: hypothetical protein WC205_04180 [Opitutaceae bacterium]|jgi:hypothetical protein
MNLQQLDVPLLGPDEAFDAEIWDELGVTPHAVAELPDVDWLRTHTVNELLGFLNDREKLIGDIASDPFRNGYEPLSWKILDALCGFWWIDHTPAAMGAERDDAKWRQMKADKAWCLKVRRRFLKRDEPIKILLLNGGNRGGKSEWAASRVLKLLMWKAGSKAWCFHQSIKMSRGYQQPLLYKYMPSEYKMDKATRKAVTYLAYKQQTGFTDEKFTLPNKSDCEFRTYEQDVKEIEGGQLNVIWCDELVPASWIKTLKARIATLGGWLFITFTPVGPGGTSTGGYSPTVKMFLDVATKTAETIAYMLPTDGKPALPELAMEGQDLAEVIDFRTGQPAVPDGREFETVPRCMTIGDKRSGVFFFHTFDNKFGNPAELVALYSNESQSDQKMRFYGVADKAVSAQFGFDYDVHALPPEKMPRDGTIYMVLDPCSGRNWAMTWARVVRRPAGRMIYFYREWPCPGKYVPGVGDFGDWAVPGEKHDGERGPAQSARRWGLKRYLQEIYRLEGRVDWAEQGEKEAEGFKFDEDDEPDPIVVIRRGRERREGEGENVYERIMDSRAAAAPTQTREGSTTLMEEMSKLGMEFVQASGGAYADDDKVHWIQLINDLLDWDKTAERDALNTPKLFVSQECKNLIFALQNWTGVDGKEGACKDFVDLVKYLVLAEADDWSERAA